MPVLAAAAATTTDARQRREVNRSRRPPARLEISRDARALLRGGSGRGCWFVVSSRARWVLCRIPNAIVQSKCWAARSIMLDSANPFLALRSGDISGIINPCFSNERSLRFACAPQSPVATECDPLSPDLLVEGKASRPAISQSHHLRPQTPANAGRLRAKQVRGGPARARAISLVQRRRISRAWRTTLPTVLSSKKRSRLGWRSSPENHQYRLLVRQTLELPKQCLQGLFLLPLRTEIRQRRPRRSR